MIWLRTFGLSVVLGVIGGCASDHNLKDGRNAFGGGYQVTPVAKSIYYIYARTNAAVLPQENAARTMFVERAKATCRSDSVEIVNAGVQLNDSEFTPLFVSEAFGYAVCPNSGLDEAAIQSAIAAYEQGR